MLNVTTKLNDKTQQMLINDVEVYFDRISYIILKDKKLFKSVISKIDNAEYIPDNIIETPFGRTVINDLSSGCKALLIALTFPEYITNFTEAGDNVLKLAVEYSKTREINIFIQKPIIGDLRYKIKLNGQDSTLLELARRV